MCLPLPDLNILFVSKKSITYSYDHFGQRQMKTFRRKDAAQIDTAAGKGARMQVQQPRALCGYETATRYVTGH